MAEHFDIILTDAGNSVGTLVKRSLERLGYKVAVCDPHQGQPCNFHTFHSRDLENFLSQIEEIVSDTGASVLLPVFYPEVISSHRDRFPSVLIPVEEASRIELLDDKISACRIAADLGIPQARIYSSIEEIEHYPVVFKRSSGHGGASVYFPACESSLRNLVKNSMPGKYLLTELIEGEDLSVDAVRYGDFFAAGAYRTLLPKAKGASVVRESIVLPQMEEYLKRILDRLDYNGVCGADFRRDADGKLYFLECNPRFCGGLDTLLAAGLDLPAVLFACVRGDKPEIPEYEAGKISGIKEEIDHYLELRRRHGRLDDEDFFANFAPI